MYIATVGYLFYFYYLTKYKLTLVTGGYQVIFIIIYNITDTLVQFKVLDHVLSAFKTLYDIQKKEVECIKLQKNGVQKDALSLQLPYVMNFLQTKGIDCNNLLAGIQQLRNMCNSEMSSKKRSRNNDTTSNSSILPTMPINKVSKVSDSNHLIEVPVAIIESPLKSISNSSVLTFSTPQIQLLIK